MELSPIRGTYWLFNASLGYVSSDGLWHAELFGKNLLNKEHLIVISTVATAGGAPGTPRTFGIRLSRKLVAGVHVRPPQITVFASGTQRARAARLSPSNWRVRVGV